MDDSILAKPVYSLSEAARLLRVTPAKLRWWMEGGTRGAKQYPPILRKEPSKTSEVSWGEFVEAAYLREYRKHLQLHHLRPLRERLTEEFGTPFPFAVAQPWTDARRLVWELQRKLDIPDVLWIVVESDHLSLSPPAGSFYKRVTFDPSTQEAIRYVIMEAPQPVYVNPLASFGIPTVRGVRTEVLAELSLAGEHISTTLDIYGQHRITAQDVETAVEFETRFLKSG